MMEENEDSMSSKLLYASPEEADSRAAGREDVAFWSAFSQEEKISFLIRAGEMLDSCMVWNCVPSVAGQELRWPRRGVLDADGMPLSETVIPEAVKHAVCEQAFFLSDPEVRNLRRFRRTGIKSAAMGGLSLSVNAENSGEKIATEALDCIRMFGHLRSDCSETKQGGTVCGTLLRG